VAKNELEWDALNHRSRFQKGGVENMRLADKRILITGAVDNIGKAAVAAFVAEGARVVIGDIDGERGEKAAKGFGGAVRFLQVDVADEESVKNLVERSAEWLGGLDVLAQNAGIVTMQRIADFDASTFDRLFAVNVRGMFLGAKYAIPHLEASGRGSIINTSSVTAKRAGPGMTIYSATKGAISSFTATLAIELAPKNIRVNAICPGWVDTSFNDSNIEFMGGRAVQEASVAATVPLGRQGRPEEMAPMFVYLASDESSYVTAQAIYVDGGF